MIVSVFKMKVSLRLHKFKNSQLHEAQAEILQRIFSETEHIPTLQN